MVKMEGHFTASKAADFYMDSLGHITTLPRNGNTKQLDQTAVRELNSANAFLATLRTEMIRLSQQLPEDETVNSMYGVGQATAAQQMTELGNVRRFPKSSSIVVFVGDNPAIDESRKHVAKNRPATKRGSPHLHKNLSKTFPLT